MRPLLAVLALLLAPAALAQEAPAFPEEAVTIVSTPETTLAGTVTVPAGEGPFPAVVVVSGSGPQDRDGATPGAAALLGDLRLYRDLAHHLARRGVLVLRYDDRGVGESTFTGEAAALTPTDFADDAAAAVQFLADRPDVRWVGVVGHSEGGALAPVVASRVGAVDGVAMVAAPAETGLATVVEQNRRLLAERGVRPGAVDSFAVAVETAFGRAAAEPGRPLGEVGTAEVRGLLIAAFEGLPPSEAAKIGLPPGMASVVADQQIGLVTSDYYRAFLALDPAVAARALEVPALALYFGKDSQVAAERNAPLMREALAASPAGEVVVLDGLNHMLQEAETGSVSEYASLAPAADPDALDVIADWVLRTAGE